MAKSGATLRWGVEAEPTLGARCSSSPRMQPRDHMSTALVYPPLDITTCRDGRQLHVGEPSAKTSPKEGFQHTASKRVGVYCREAQRLCSYVTL